MTAITPEQARSYLDRWKAVGDREAKEWRNSSVETRLRQVSALISSRGMFKDRDQALQVSEVRARWAKIRSASHG